jgi:hypothetical protein
MSISAFDEAAHKPTMDEMRAAVGSKRKLWDEVIALLTEGCGIPGEFNFYSPKYGWAISYRRGGKAFISLYPGRGHFIAQIVLGPSVLKEALAAVSGPTRTIIEGLHQYHDGRWLFLEVASVRALEDVKRLLAVKSPPPRVRRAAASS